MKVQIIVEDNIIIIDDKSKQVDCSQFDFRFCEVNEDKRWVERLPFTGPEDLDDWSKVEDFIALHASEEAVEDQIIATKVYSISRRQARIYLLNIDKLDEVEEFIATNRMYQIEYEADTFERSNLIIPIIQELLGLTDAQVDEMFLAASGI